MLEFNWFSFTYDRQSSLSITYLDHFDHIPTNIVRPLWRYEYVLVSGVIPGKLEKHLLYVRPVHLVQVHVQLVQGPERRLAHLPEGQDEAGQRPVESSGVKFDGFGLGF